VSVQLTLSPPFLLPDAASPSTDIAMPCPTSFPWSQDEFVAPASSFDNALSCRFPSTAKIEALNPHHCCWPPSSDRPTPTLHCYKKVISTLVTLPTTQPFCLLPSQSTMPSELHPPPPLPFTIVLCPSSLCTTTPTMTN
jgi:hypothetical protein